MEEKKLSLIEKAEAFDKMKDQGIKYRPLKIPRKAKVRKGKLKKGWVGIVLIDENGNASGEKQRIKGSCYRTKDGIYHATDGREIIMWEGKFPVLFQQTWKINPINFRSSDDEPNETYGQSYIMARMLADVIKIKGKGGSWIIWLLIGGAILFVLNYFKVFS